MRGHSRSILSKGDNMNKTEHYQLNQWDPEDRILRVDFNADNAAIESALKENADAISAETAARSAADTSIRTDFAAADTAIRTDFAAADKTIKNSVTSEANTRSAQDAAIRSEFAAADTAIRTDFAAADKTIKSSVTTETTNRKNADAAIREEFAAADTAIRGEIALVKLLDTTTTAATTQIDVSVSSLNLTQYRKVIIIPTIKLATAAKKSIYVRVNKKSTEIYTNVGSARTYLSYFTPASGYSTEYMNGGAELNMYLGSDAINCITLKATGENVAPAYTCAISASSLAPASLSTINFYATDSVSLAAGSRITIYGVK